MADLRPSPLHEASPATDLDHKTNAKSDNVDVDVATVGREAPAAVLEELALGDPVYAAKARLLNKAIMEIGMGTYQWQVSRHGFF